MKKKDPEIPTRIQEEDFVPELESEVRYHLSQAPPQVKNSVIYTRTAYPKFDNHVDEENYQLEEFRRCKEGYNGMCGKMYFFFYYCFLRDPERGRIRPDFRTISRDWFQFIEDHQKERDKRGIVCIKRRRIGASWMEASDVLHDCIFIPFFQVGMNSRDEKASRDLFKHVKFIYQNLPEWMRPRSSASDRRDHMEFAWYEKDAQGNRVKKGNQSWITSVAPSDSAHEGAAYSKLIMDEAGKTPNLPTLWVNSQDCLMKPPRRVGLPIIFGTVGDIDKDGKGLKEMWINNEVYKFDRFFFAGYNALDGMIDDYGNDLQEDAIRWIIYERHRLRTVRKELEAFKQKYPLNERDAFNQMSGGGVGNIQLINDQIFKITSNPPEQRVGWMRRKPDGGVDFVPNSEGKVIVYSMPMPGVVDGYVAGSDNADHEGVKKSRDVSNLALAIIAKPHGVASPQLVLEYVDRPEKLDSFFEQTAMCLQWYNNTKVLIEDNRARMINYFKTNYPQLLPLIPRSLSSARGGVEMMHSIKMTEVRKQQMIGLIEDNVDKYSEFIPSSRLLEEFKVFGDDHADDDLAIAYGWALFMLQTDKKIARNSSEIDQNKVRDHYEKINGVIIRVNSTNENVKMIRNRNIPKSLFTKN